MKTLIFSIAFLLGTINISTAQDFFLPVSTTSKTAKAAYYKAEEAASNINFKEANEQLDKAFAVAPNFFMAYALKIFYAPDEKKPALIDKALAIDASNFNKAENIVRQQMVLWDKDPKAKIGKKMKALVAAYPTTPQAYNWAALHAAYTDRDTDAGLTYAKKLMELSPDFAPNYNSMGYMYLEKKQMDKAKAAFEKYLALAPNEANPYDSMGEFYMINKDYPKSVEYYDKAATMGMSSAMERADKARAAMKGNTTIVNSLYEAFAKGDILAALSYMDAGIVWNEADNFPYSDKNPYIGPDAVLNGVFARIGADWEYWNLKDIKLHDMSGNQVLATLRYDAKHKVTGKVIDSQTAHWWTLRNGKIVAFQQFTDTKQAAEAVEK